jgi:hypothetical protein
MLPSTIPSPNTLIRTFGIFLDPKNSLPLQAYPNSHLHRITRRTVKLAHNGEPDDVLKDELREYLGQFGVRVGPTLEAMMRRFARTATDADMFALDADLFDAMDDWI